MKLAVCAQGEGITAKVDERFGRCPFFVIVNTENEESVVSVRNTHAEASGGAGPQAAQLLAGLGVDAVAVGNMGPNAVEALKTAKINAYTGITGTVKDSVKKFKDGKLVSLSEATVSSHAGMRGNKGGRGQ